MIAPGTRLGPYEITDSIGAGGMGEVYRARDSRLDRTVAIKVLPESLSSDERLRERFEREARAISALTHPNICTLYDIGRDDGVDYLVMEYLEGESLAERIGRGPLPIDHVMRHGIEIAEALDKAHRSGIVHRDLKPGNVILTRGGAKLLDFGLAKIANSPLEVSTASMTQQKPLTEEGTILGTFQYMAPEQIEGREADARTDIFSLGAVLYEMATGKRAFEAKSRASLIASILDREPPPISTVQPLTPPAFERVVRLCLAKDPDERWQNAHDVAAELRWIRDTSSATIGPGAKRTRLRHFARAAALVMAGIVAGASATWLAMRDTSPVRRLGRFSIPAAASAPVSIGSGTMDISPDGSHVVYRGRVGREVQLYVRAASAVSAVPLAGTVGARSPAFSPDGRWIAFVDEEALKKVPMDGGTPVKLCATSGGALGIRWIGNTIYFARGFTDGIWSIDANGGEARQVARVDPAKNYRAVVWPEVLPGEQTLLATVWNAGSWDDAKVVAYSLRDGTSRVVIDGGTFARYLPSGHLLYGRGTSIMAVPFDPKTLKVGGAPVAVVNGVSMETKSGEPLFAVSNSGDLVYIPGGSIESNGALVWVDRQGRETEVVPTRRPYAAPELSPDGRRVAVTLETAMFDVWLLDIERDLMTRVSFAGDDADPIFSPDGRHVIWRSSRSGVQNLYRAAVDGSTGEERLTTSPREQFVGTMSPDGRDLVFMEMTTSGNRDLFVLSMDTRKTSPLMATRFDETGATFSPDGTWISYSSNESGQRETYVRPFRSAGGKWQISTGGGATGAWTADGKEVIYRQGTKIFAVAVERHPEVRIGKPRLIVDRAYDGGWDLAPDGRLLLVRDEAPSTVTQMNIVLNWTDDLQRRVPVQ